MRFSRLGAALCASALALAVLLPADLSAQITRGAILGTVRDTSGAVIPGATVTVTNQATNITRETFTDELGFYRVPALDPGVYTVKAELAGFQTVEFPDIRLVAAGEVTLNATLAVAGIGEEVSVTASSMAVELNKTSPTIGATVTARQVVELPLSADRNVNNLIATAPNVSRVTGQGTFAAAGQRSRNNNYMIDGSDNNDISVTIATSQVVPEAVAEFQVQTNAYSVEFGRNSGAQVNVITKSGTNLFRGEGWEYYDTSKLRSLTNIQKSQGLTEPPKRTRHQTGVSLGGPVVRDRTFFFGLYQYDPIRTDAVAGATIRVPTQSGFAALQNVPLGAGQTTASRQAVLQRLQFLQDVYANNPAFRNLTNVTVNGVPIQTGQINVDRKAPSTYHYVMGRVDHRLTNADNLTVRYYLNRRQDTNVTSNTQFGSLFAANQDITDTNFAASHTRIFGPSVVNEFRFSWVRRDLAFPENDPTSPTAAISGLFTIGGLSNFPQGRVTDAFQFNNVMTWAKGRHTLKIGADIRYNKADNASDFNSKGNFTFNNLQDYMNNMAFGVTQALQTASWLAKQWQNSFFVQDDFRLTPDFTLNMGVRYEISTVPFGMFGATDPESLAALVPGPVEKDLNNWGPRVGFAWSPRSQNPWLGDGLTVFRGGFGMAYDVLFYNLLTVNGSNYPRLNTLTENNVQNLYPNLLTGSATPVFSPTASYTNSAEDTENPESRFWSFSVGRELGQYLIEWGYLGNRTYKGINQIHANPAVLTPAQAALVAATQNPGAIPGVQARRVYPQFGVRTLIPATVGPAGNDVEARSTYHGTYVSVNKRFSDGYQFGLSYTFSKYMSNNDASLGETGTDGSSQRPQSFFNYEAEWSRSQFDVPHRFVVNYLWELPGPKEGVIGSVIGGWQLSGVTAYQSGRPFTIWIGVDSNGDGTTGSDRPNRNGSCGVTWDSDHRNFTNNNCYFAPLGTNGLPLQNGLGDGNAPRNGERSKGYWNTDMSLMKRFRLWGHRQVMVRADAFNVFNQDEYGIPTSNMNSASFGTNGQNWGLRTFTLSVKFSY